MERLEIKFSANLYDDAVPGKKPKLIKKGVTTKRSVDIRDINYPEQIFNDKGNIIKGKCKIVLKDVGPVIVSHSYEYFHKLLSDETINPIGFKYKGKK